MGKSVDPASTSKPIHRASGINYLSSWIQRLPGASWHYYLGLWLLLVIAQLLLLSLDGADPFRAYRLPAAFLSGATVLLLGLFHYFDLRAGHALKSTRPILTVDDATYEELLFRLTRLPLGRPLVAGLVSVGLMLLVEALDAPYWLEPFQEYANSVYFLRVIYLICWALFGAFIYQTLHRLRLIHIIYTRHTRVNLLGESPLYPLSDLLALSAVSLTALPIAFFLANNLTDMSVLDPATIILLLAIQAIAFVSFLWPQLGIHRLQRLEKNRLLYEVRQRCQTVFQELNRRVDQGNLGDSSDLNSTMTLLEKELESVEAISIWPWDPETMRWLVTALVLPIAVMLLQLILQ